MNVATLSKPFTASSAYRGYVLVLLIAVGVFAWIDRNVFAILLESIKVDLALSDTQLGLLGGVAFGVFYAAVGLPIAWLADRYDRSALIALALGLWSVMTALCGSAGGFASLFLARVGVGVGEAGGSPPSQALIADYFPPQRRAFALGVYYFYVPLGFLAGFLAGGVLDALLGWRLAFAVVGMPGVALAIVVRLTLREPPRGFAERLADADATPSLAATLRYFVGRATLRHLPLAGAIHGIGAFAVAVWLPAYFIRVFDVTSAEAGAWMALAYGLGGGAGVLFGGYAADRLVARSGEPRWYAWGSAAAIAAAMLAALPVFVTASPAVAVASLTIATTFMHMFLGPVTAMIQALAGLRRRAVAAALYLFLANLVSMGVGPVVVGIASDRLAPRFGDRALGLALLAIVIVTSVWSALHFVLAARSLRADLAAAGATASRSAFDSR
jgi:MFS family permease